MSTGTRLNLKDAIATVQSLAALMNLDSLCEPWDAHWATNVTKPGWGVAGSVRRRKPDVGDIEIITVPKPSGHDLMGQAISNEVADCLDRLLRRREIEHSDPKCWGAKLRRFIYQGVKIEMIMTTREAAPVLLAIRTGPQEFSKSLVTERCYGGRLPDGHRVSVAEGLVYRKANSVTGQAETPLQFKSEREFLGFCGGWVEPKDRL